MEEREKIIELYELYKGLLTENQRLYFENYYYEDLSLNEIADNNKVSKTLVSKIINNTIKKLEHYEEILNFNYKENKLKNLLNKIDDSKIKTVIEEILYKD
jgi:predicted DNA-binding protein YlxM (UPF0122 family)